MNDKQIGWIEELAGTASSRRCSTPRSSPPAILANRNSPGIWGAVVGSFFTLLVTLALSFPIGVASGGLSGRVRAEEQMDRSDRGQHQQPRGRAVDRLRSARSRGVHQLLRHAALGAAGRRLVLTLMTLPTIIIAGRAAIKSVPPSIARPRSVSALRLQTTIHHVLPLAMPGMLTGTIIGMARRWAKRRRC